MKIRFEIDCCLNMIYTHSIELKNVLNNSYKKTCRIQKKKNVNFYVKFRITQG